MKVKVPHSKKWRISLEIYMPSGSIHRDFYATGNNLGEALDSHEMSETGQVIDEDMGKRATKMVLTVQEVPL